MGFSLCYFLFYPSPDPPRLADTEGGRWSRLADAIVECVDESVDVEGAPPAGIDVVVVEAEGAIFLVCGFVHALGLCAEGDVFVAEGASCFAGGAVVLDVSETDDVLLHGGSEPFEEPRLRYVIAPWGFRLRLSEGVRLAHESAQFGNIVRHDIQELRIITLSSVGWQSRSVISPQMAPLVAHSSRASIKVAFSQGLSSSKSS